MVDKILIFLGLKLSPEEYAYACKLLACGAENKRVTKYGALVRIKE